MLYNSHLGGRWAEYMLFYMNFHQLTSNFPHYSPFRGLGGRLMVYVFQIILYQHIILKKYKVELTYHPLLNHKPNTRVKLNLHFRPDASI